MNEESNVHQMLKVVYINTKIENLESMVKKLNRDK